MIAQNSWFKRRKYGGWGLTPMTWQGWAYILAISVSLIVFHALPFWSVTIRVYMTLGWLVFLMVDLIPIMVTVKRDELEHRIEAIAERNAAWVMSLVLVSGLVYETIASSLAGEFRINWFLAVALLSGASAKSITNYYLEKKGFGDAKKQ